MDSYVLWVTRLMVWKSEELVLRCLLVRDTGQAAHVTKSTALSVGKRYQMMLFPGIWVSHGGQVLSVELVVQPSQQLTAAKVQILRPYCSPSHHLVPPGCRSILNPFTCCSVKPLCNTTGGCSSGQYWCHLVESCLPVTSPCSPYHSSANGHVFTLPPRYTALTPFYHMVADIALEIPSASEPVHIDVRFKGKKIPVFPDDILAIQHSRKSGEFLHCTSGSDSVWRQSYISIPGPEWGGWVDVALSSLTEGGHWLDNMSCDLRLIYQDPGHLNGVGKVTQNEPSTEVSMPGNILIPAQTPVTGMHILYPVLDKDNRIHLAVNVQTLFIIKILSGSNATSSWSGLVSRTEVPFLKSCPEEIPEMIRVCKRDSADTWFSYAPIMATSQGEHTLDVTASNQLNSQRLSVKIQAHVIITGLRIQPQGFHRVLVNIPQMFTTAVATGSSVKYTWVIDDLIQFAHTGDAYSITFNKPAEYTLKVTAENPVSTQYMEVKLTADVMTPLADLALLSETVAVAVNTSSVFTVQVKLDVSIGVTISTKACWQVIQYHGDYTLRIQAQNKYDFIQTAVLHKVRSPLTKLLVISKPASPKINQTILFEASSQPSSHGIVYTWNFGDGFPEVEGPHKTIRHAFKKAGVFNVSVISDNTLSKLNSWMVVEVFEMISGVHLGSNSPSELNSIIKISGGVSTGTSLRWTFDLGDGTVFKDLKENSISYVYRSVGNYTVQAMVWNEVSSEREAIDVEIYQLAVLGILPLECVVSGKEVTLQALVRGNVSHLAFYWRFGDSKDVSVKNGIATVAHTFSGTGNYLIGVTIQSQAGSADYQSNLCVENSITDLNLHSSLNVAALGKEICFDVSVLPAGGENYQFHWYNSSFCDCPVNGTSHHCFIFFQEGKHEITVMAQNQVSKKTASTTILVQRPLSVRHNGELDVLTVNQTYYFWTEPSKNNAAIEWDFGDGSLKSRGQNVSHNFTSAGQYHISASVLNAVSKEIIKVDVQVQVPISNIRIHTNRPFAEAGQEAVFTISSDVMENVKFYWMIDSMTFSELGTSEYRYVFPKAGIFQIRVTAQNPVSKVETSLTIEVVERIQGVRIMSLKSASYIPTNETVTLVASVSRGTSLTYQWLANQAEVNDLVGVGEHFQFYTIHPGDHRVTLNVSNEISWQSVSHVVTVQDAIRGFSLRASDVIVCENDPVTFTPSITQGSGVSFLLEFPEGNTSLEDQEDFTTSSIPLGNHTIKAIAKNLVSILSVNITIRVVQGLKGLHLVDCCSSVLEASKPVHFKASVNSGSKVIYRWNFHLDGLRTSQQTGQSVLYSPFSNGTLTVMVEAKTDFCSQSITETALVQQPVKNVTLFILSEGPFVNHSVTFFVLVDGGSDLAIKWSFGDEIRLTKSNKEVYKYKVDGKFMVQVTVFNNISQVSAHFPVLVRKLKCIQPRVALVQEQARILKSQPNYFEASVDLNGCTSYKTNYLWEIFRDPDCTERKVFLHASVDVTKPLLAISKNTLEVGDYCVKFSTWFEGTPLRHHKTGGFSVGNSPLVPLIKGGSIKVWSNQKDLVLDGSWVDEDNISAQMIYALQIAQCQSTETECPLITLYRGIRSAFGTLVPMGSTRPGHNASILTVMVTVEDNMGAKITAVKRNLVVMVPVRDQDMMEWLKNKSQEELWDLVKQGNPQDVISYAMAMSSQLNQIQATSMQELKDKVQMRGNVTQALASLSVSSLQDASQISSALAHSTAVTSEMQCGDCNSQVVEAVGKMIGVIREQTRQGDLTPIDTGRNILNVLSTSMTVKNPVDALGSLLHGPKHHDTAVSALYQVGQLMRSLMWSRMPGEEALLLQSPRINATGKRGDPASDLLCTDPSSSCQFYIPSNLSSRLRAENQEVVQIVLVLESEEIPFVSPAEPPISTKLTAMEFLTPHGSPIPVSNLTEESAIRVTLHNKKMEVSGRVNVTLRSEGSVNFMVRAVETEPNAGLFITFNFSLSEGSSMPGSGKVTIIISDEQTVHQSQHTHVKELILASFTTSVEETIFLEPVLNGSAKDLYVTLRSSTGVDLCVSVCVFSSLCQFFDMERRRWSTGGATADHPYPSYSVLYIGLFQTDYLHVFPHHIHKPPPWSSFLAVPSSAFTYRYTPCPSSAHVHLHLFFLSFGQQ
ncbi:polycystin-1 isoform X2 [Silurus meridionalis]|nr:polycystin-1 isoform X2 [Silurus meridionalis]